VQVRAQFGAKLRAEAAEALSNGALASVAGACQLCKLVAMMCLAACDPQARNRDAVMKALVATLTEWQARLAQGVAAPAPRGRAARAHAAAQAAERSGEGEGEVASGAKGTRDELALQPEYSVFFMMFLLAQHDDCPAAADLMALRHAPAHPAHSERGAAAGSGAEEGAGSEDVADEVRSEVM
jgi:hypothetical protein